MIPTMSEDSCTFGISQRGGRVGPQPISFLMAQGVENPDVIPLAAGLVDYDTLPTGEVRELLDRMLSEGGAGQAALQYGTTAGLAPLREALLEHMRALDGLAPTDLDAGPDDMLVTSGSQQLLFLLAEVLLDPGDIVITGWPSYFVYTGTLEAGAARVRCVDIDDKGVVPEKLDGLLGELAQAGELPRVKIVYLCTYHQNPTGITRAAERKQAILDIVRKFSGDHRILLLEDAAYREPTYEGSPPASFKVLDRENRFAAVIQTFSKPFAPGLKTGYGLLPRDLIEPVILQKGNHDFGSANLCQHLVLAAMREGVYQRHLETLRTRYAAKRDAMLAALDEHLGDFAPGETSWTHPTGGLYVYLTLPEGIDTGREGRLFDEALAEGVLYVPGEYCYAPDPARSAPRNSMRLSFGVADEEAIREGIARLSRAVKRRA